MNKFLVFFALLIILIFGGFYFVYQLSNSEEQPVTVPVVAKTPKLLNKVMYMCNGAKTIDSAFYEHQATTSIAVGQRPTPNGSVALVLSDGRTFNLPQTISADGARYANADETFVFWTKGNAVIVLEDGTEKNYIGCILIAPVAVGVNLPAMYASTDGSFSLRLPSLKNANADGYSVNESFKNVLSPNVSIDGVKFTIPSAKAKGTNLAEDSYLSVEHLETTQACTANLFFDDSRKTVQKTEGDRVYSIATSSSAGAGNRYEEIVYAIFGTNPCLAVRYMIHYSVLENYATGTVVAYNKEELITEFENIRKTVVLNQ